MSIQFEAAEQNRRSVGFLPARRVWERYCVTPMTLHRWLQNENMAFPKPVYLGRFRYWRLADLESWEGQQIRERRDHDQ